MDSEGQMAVLLQTLLFFFPFGCLQMHVVNNSAFSALKCSSKCDREPFNGLIWFGLIC